MSTIIVDQLQPNIGGQLSLDGDVLVNGNLSADTLYGDSSNLTKAINNIIPVGSGITSVNSYLQYGFNLISTANTGNFCVRLPETPIEGRDVTVVNNSGFDVYVFPSMAGGSVNGTVNGFSIVPSDSRTYTFFCYENPNPGAWSGNIMPTAAGVYDSGVISIDTTSSVGGFVTAVDDNFKGFTAGGFDASFAGMDGLNKPVIMYLNNAIYFKPPTYWNFIDKVTVYTNLTTGATAPGNFAVLMGETANYYSAGTTYYMNNGPGRSPYDMQPTYYGTAGQRLTGTPNIVSSGYTANPGEPGTYFGELTYSLSGRPSMIGDILLSSGTMYLSGGIEGPGFFDLDYINSNYITFQFDTNRNSPDVKFRFLIEYT